MTANAFAVRLKKARSERKLTQGALAKAAGIAAAQLSRYELGDNTPRSETIAKLSEALGVSFEWLSDGIAAPSTHRGKALEVTVSKHPDGGSEITFDMDEEMSDLFQADAIARGMSMEDYLKEMVLSEVRARIESATGLQTKGVDINELAAKVKELIEADTAKKLPFPAKSPK